MWGYCQQCGEEKPANLRDYGPWVGGPTNEAVESTCCDAAVLDEDGKPITPAQLRQQAHELRTELRMENKRYAFPDNL